MHSLFIFLVLFSITWFLTYIYFIFAWDTWAAIEEIIHCFLWREENSHDIEDQGGIMTYHKKVEDGAVYHWRFFGGDTFQHQGCILGTDLGRNLHMSGTIQTFFERGCTPDHEFTGSMPKMELTTWWSLEWLDTRNTGTIPLYKWISNFKFQILKWCLDYANQVP